MAGKRKPQKGPDSRPIVVSSKFDYYWPGRSAVTAFTPGEYRVKNEVADYAVKKGYASEGKLEKDATAEAADAGSEPGVGNADAAHADWPIDRPSVDSDAG